MRSLWAILLAIVMAAALAGCWPFEPASSPVPGSSAGPTPDAGGSPPLSSFPVPGPTTKPGVPTPTIEIPPPVD